MIITKTPLRISFLGGGTDFRAFFRQEEGWVLSSAIDKFIYVIIKERFDSKIRVGYTRTELVDSIDELQHELVRESLRKTGITQGVEISTMADIPSEGSGLGSSSTVTVGLLNAMYAYLNTPVTHERLAREACAIEIDILHKPIGVQDQYIAAYGSQRLLFFGRNDEVCVQPLGFNQEQLRKLNQSLMLFYTNVTRKAESVLAEQAQNIDANHQLLRQMKALTLQARTALEKHAFDDFGALLDESWQVKKRLASRISTPAIDDLYAAARKAGAIGLYAAARKAGAIGGKISGAGGGGFLLLYCSPQHQDAVRHALASLRELPFRLEPDGSKVIFHCN